jgi:hypothetical protein
MTCVAVHAMTGDVWVFVNACYGLIIFIRDLHPNVGLFWYLPACRFDSRQG